MLRGMVRGMVRRVSGLSPLARASVLSVGLMVLMLALTMLSTPTVSATSVAIVKQTTEGTLKIQPGDWVSAGYVLRAKGKTHPAMNVRIRNAYVRLGLRCDGSSTKVGEIIVPLHPQVTGGAQTYSVAVGDERWWPTKDLNLADGFQGGVRAPDPSPCPAGKLMVNDGSAGGATFTADIESDNELIDIEVKFHYRVPRPKYQPNLNCADPAVNPPPGVGACTAHWGSSVTIRGTALGDSADAERPPQVNGRVFNDLNGNKVLDNGEPGIGGVLVELYDTATGRLVSSEPTEAVIAGYLGYYNMLTDPITPMAGPYRVVITVPAGYTATSPTDVRVDVPLDGGSTTNFGLRATQP